MGKPLERTSQFSGFYKLTPEQRLDFVKNFAGLTDEEVSAIKAQSALKLEDANRMIENVVGTFPLPMGIAVNFLINKKDYLIPMAIEEPSVVAAASNAARMARVTGGFTAIATESFMRGQIQVVNVPDPNRAKLALLEAKEDILSKANSKDPILVSKGGGAKELEVKVLKTEVGSMVIAEILVDCLDAMGANAVNTMAEAVAPFIEEVTGGRVYLRIISNLADRRIARARATFSKDVIGGEDVVDGIVKAYAFAASDPYRCATHNKGIMNGITAVVLATGNDTRAVEAGAHAYAARTGRYLPLTTWEKNKEGNLVGTIELPLALGIVGGLTRVHPVARANIKILGVSSSKELAEVVASVGLAQNFAALRALVAEGIQRGHMALHARNIAAEVGATGELVDIVAARMMEEKAVRWDRAKQILDELRQKKV
ncbi:MAG: hydroxymethylglutaryl-CoA reductase, degradative [Candidatus Bathyarchaeia archaeon]